MSNYKLVRVEIGTKSAAFRYDIIDEAGTILYSRKSNRIYVAATIDGNFFFGRLDLIGKGDHGQQRQFQDGYRWNPGKRKYIYDPTAPKESHTPIAYL